MTTNFGAVDVVPLQGANFCFIYFQDHQFYPNTQENNNGFCLELLANIALFSALITKIGFGYLESIPVFFLIIK